MSLSDFYNDKKKKATNFILGDNAFGRAVDKAHTFVRSNPVTAAMNDYGKKQILDPLTDGVAEMIEAKNTNTRGGSFDTAKNVAFGALKAGQGAFSATPAGVGFNTYMGTATAGARAVRGDGGFRENLRENITRPSSFATEGLDVKNPFAAMAIDTLVGNPRGTVAGVRNLKNLRNAGTVRAAASTVWQTANDVAGFNPKTASFQHIDQDIMDAANGARTVVNTGMRKGRSTKLMGILDKDVPTHSTQVLENGGRANHMYTPDYHEVPNSHVEFYRENGRFPKEGEVVPDLYNIRGTSRLAQDPKTGEFIHFSTDNPEFAKHVTGDAFSAGLSTRAMSPSEIGPEAGQREFLRKKPAATKPSKGWDSVRPEDFADPERAIQVQQGGIRRTEIEDVIGKKSVEQIQRVFKSKAYQNGRIDASNFPVSELDAMAQEIGSLRGDSSYGAEQLLEELGNLPTHAQLKAQMPERIVREKGGRAAAAPEDANSPEALAALERTNPEIRKQQAVDGLLQRGGKPMPEPTAAPDPSELASLDRSLRREPGYQNVPGSATRNAPNGEQVTLRDRGGVPVEKGLQDAVDSAIKGGRDKSTMALNNQTPGRNIEDVFGKDADIIKSYLPETAAKNETARVQWQDSEVKSLRGEFTERLGIKLGSKEDKLAHQFAEKKISLEELQKVAPKTWQNVAEAAGIARSKYDQYLGQINEQLKRFGYPEVPKRADYITHVNELNGAYAKFGDLMNIPKNEFSKTLDALKGETRPGKPSFGFGKERKGEKHLDSVINAMDAYIPSASRQIFHTETVQNARILQKVVKATVEKQPTTTALNNFSGWLSSYADTLAGKGNALDTAVEKTIGKKVPKIIDALRKRTSANMVGANISSAMTNFIPFTQSFATTSKTAAVRGLAESVGAPFLKQANVIDGLPSSFLTRRFGGKETIGKTTGQAAMKTAGWAFEAIDKTVARSVVSGKFYEGLQKGLGKAEAMKAADDYAARLMADRSFGQMPELYTSKTAGLITQFQLEVNNQISFLFKDVPKMTEGNKLKMASVLGQVALYSYLFNSIYEKATGRRPAIDPIYTTLNAMEDAEEGDGKKFWQGLAENVSKSLPYASTVTGGGRIPISSAVPNPFAVLSGESTVGKELKKPAAYLLPPTGGGQIKKTLEGMAAYGKGYSETDSGGVRFPIEKNDANAFRTALFGQYSTPEGSAYFKSGDKPLSKEQSEAFKASGADKAIYDQTIQNRKETAEADKLVAGLNKQDPNAAKAAAPAGTPVADSEVETSSGGSDLGITQKGKYYFYQDSEGQTQYTTKKKTAEKARVQALLEGGEKRVRIGDTLYGLDKEGNVKDISISKEKRSVELQGIENGLNRAKDDEEYGTWEDLQKKKYALLQQEWEDLDPEMEASERLAVENKLYNIAYDINKYGKTYGGSFKKPRKPKKPSRNSIKVSYGPSNPFRGVKARAIGNR